MSFVNQNWPIIPILLILGIGISHLQTRGEVNPTSVPYVSIKGSYVTSQGRYHTFRIPGMIVTSNGSILAFAEGRRGKGSDPRRDKNAPIDLVMRRSIDQGITWEPLVVIDSGFRADGSLVDFGDPTPVFDLEMEKVFLFYGQWPDIGADTVAHGQSANAKDGNHVVWVRSTSDNGTTWSNRVQVVYPDTPDKTSDGLYWRQAEPGPGNGIQLQWQREDTALNGRLVVPAKRRGSRMPTSSEIVVDPFVYYSDDHGESWQVGRTSKRSDGNEDEIVELTDGRLLLDARQNKGKFRRRQISFDGGLTWGADYPDNLPLTAVDGSMVRYSSARAGQNRDRILFSAPRGRGGLNRNVITVWTSYDEGEHFVNPVEFNSGFAAYSALQRLSDGSIGLLVETAQVEGERYGEITFYRFDITALEASLRFP